MLPGSPLRIVTIMRSAPGYSRTLLVLARLRVPGRFGAIALLGLCGCEAIDHLYETEYSVTLHFGDQPDSRPSSRPASGPASQSELLPQSAPKSRS